MTACFKKHSFISENYYISIFFKFADTDDTLMMMSTDETLLILHEISEKMSWRKEHFLS